MQHELDPTPIICQGEWHGEISTKRHGDGGFGYDPVFWVPEQNCSAAELDKNTKNRISHRGKALVQLMQRMKVVLTR
jgi:XTP/dITP diphosphohydrolase